MIKKITLLLLSVLAATAAMAATPILGQPVATVDRMYQYVKSMNPGSSFTYEMAQKFHDIGAQWGVRGDIALCQSCIETGWFNYTGGTAVTPDDHNYCGLGVTTTGQKGCQFDTMEEGINAQLQHLWSYATTASLPSGWTLVDPRFNHGSRGKAPNWENLGNGYWASASGYGTSILSIYSDMMAYQVANPKLTASTTQVSLTAAYGGTSPTKKITITGQNLSTTIRIASNSSVINTATSSWNDYTGGTLTLSLDTSKAPGTYDGAYVAVEAGSGDNKVRVEINVTAVITGTVTPDPEEPGDSPIDFQQVWNLSQTAGNVSFAGSVRNFDQADGKLYCVYNHSEIKVVNARTGAEIKTLDNGSVVDGGALTLCDVKCFNGKVYACNLATSGGQVRVYRWDDDDSAATLLMSSDDMQSTTRLGDCLDISGTDKRLVVSMANDNGTVTRIVQYIVTSSGVTAKTIKATTDGSTQLASGTSSRVRVTSSGFEIDGKSILPSTLNSSGKLLTQMTGESCTHGNDFATFSYGGKDYMLLATYLNAASTTYSDGIMRLYDVTDGWDKASRLADYPPVGLGTTRNTNTTGSLRVYLPADDCVEAWILTTGQGMAYYRAGSLPDNPDPSTPDEPSTPETAGLPNNFAQDWCYSAANGTSTTYMNPADDLTRNMVMKGDNLYVVRRGTSECDIHIVDAYTGAAKGSLPTTGLSQNSWLFSSVANMGGTLIACNLAFSSTTVLRVYSWASDTAAPQLVLETTDHAGRSGDLMCATGTIADGKIYLATNSAFSGYEGRLMVYTVTGGTASATPQVITLKDADGKAYDLGGTFAVIEIRAMADGTIQASGAGGTTAWFKADGTFIREMDAKLVGGNVAGSSTVLVDYGNYKLAAAVSYAGTGRTGGYLTLADITDSASTSVIKDFDQLGTSSNTTGVTTAIAAVDSDSKIHLWTLIPKQGIAKYTAWASTTSVAVPDADETSVPEEWYTLQGTRVDGGNLARGIYLRRQGSKVTKVAVR